MKQFEVGKWYRYKHPHGDYYLKCSKESELPRIYYEDYINTKESKYNKQSESYFNNEYVTNIEVPVSGIQQYLPEGHPDKQPKKFKAGDWLIREKDGSSANKVTKGNAYQIITVSTNQVTVKNDNGKIESFILSNFRRAKPGEIPQEKWIPKVGDWVQVINNSGEEFILQIKKDNGGTWFYGDKIGSYYKYKAKRKALPHEIPSQEMSKEELLARARRLYPPGTRYKDVDGRDYVFVVGADNYWVNYELGKDKIVSICAAKTDRNQSSGEYIWRNGKWAEIVEPASAAEMIKESYDWSGKVSSQSWESKPAPKPRLILLEDNELLSVKCDNEVKIKLIDYV